MHLARTNTSFWKLIRKGTSTSVYILDITAFIVDQYPQPKLEGKERVPLEVMLDVWKLVCFAQGLLLPQTEIKLGRTFKYSLLPPSSAIRSPIILAGTYLRCLSSLRNSRK